MSNVTEFNQEDIVWWAGEIFFIYSFNEDDTVNLKKLKKDKNNFCLNVSVKNLTKVNKIETVSDWRLMIAQLTLQSLIES